MENEKTKLETALEYAKMGLCIIPVGPNKISLIKWEPYQNRCSTIDEINMWWRQWPQANPALVTGMVSGVVALDLDKKYSRTSKEFTLPPTACAKSGSGGEHFFFKYPSNTSVKSGSAISGLGVDCRGDKGYILLSPSINENGGIYEWIVPLESKNDLAEMPDWLLKITTTQSDSDKKWLMGKDGVLEGQRNDTAASMSGKILSSTVPELQESLGWEQLRVWNSKNIPSIPEKELRSVWESIKKRHVENKPQQKIKGKALIQCFADIQPEPISWLWPERIALGKLTLIAGDPGLGKSLISTSIAAAISKGYLWPVDNTVAPIGDVVFISAEDDPADTVRPRLDAAGADCSRIHILKAIQCVEVDADGKPTQRMFSLKNDIPVLEEVMSALPNCKLIVVDPISAYMDGTESHANADVRGLLAPLAELAGRYKVAVVAISHLNKNNNGNAMYRTMGSLAFIAAARAAFLVTKDKDTLGRVLVLPIKNNIAKVKTGLAYSVIEAENGAPLMAWESKPVEMTADDALSIGESNDEKSDTDWAIDFLEDILRNGPVSATEIIKDSKRLGIKEKALRRAREKLNIKTKKLSFTGGWSWSLSTGEDAQGGEGIIPKIDGILDGVGHLGGQTGPIPDDIARNF